MHQRCSNPNRDGYEYYGGRGIKVCERWKNFELFLSDMGVPDAGMSIDRIDSDGDYSPENCRWVDLDSQKRNQRRNIVIELEGEKRCLTEWARIKGLPPIAVNKRLKRGWTIEMALSTPLAR